MGALDKKSPENYSAVVYTVKSAGSVTKMKLFEEIEIRSGVIHSIIFYKNTSVPLNFYLNWTKNSIGIKKSLLVIWNNNPQQEVA